MKLIGAQFINGARTAEGESCFQAENRLEGGRLEPAFHVASSHEIELAAKAADEASIPYAAESGDRKAGFLEQIATEIESLGSELIERANLETALPEARLVGERGRTCGQLRMFAQVLREGSWVEARIDHPIPDRSAGPKPDLRRMMVPLGPIAVFGASNFPFAYSVAGGDTASALAAGCPVVVKAHPSHPGTSELTAYAITRAISACGMPSGVFGMVAGGAEVGSKLVTQSEIAAVGFTGSKKAGRALFDLAAKRPRPIPVYAEMGSVNPIFLLPGALAARASEIASTYAGSLTVGVGQFCTNPGIVVGIAGKEFDGFLEAVRDHLQLVSPGIMLNGSIASTFAQRVQEWTENASLTQLVASSNGLASPALFSVSAKEFLANPELAEELFGPAALAVVCASTEEMSAVAGALEGQLTATIHFESDEIRLAQTLMPRLVRMAGRVVANGVPTGVEVCASMQHGGPYPASTDARTTSVGSAAISRFVRPVAFQNMPEELLPIALRNENPLDLLRIVDGKWDLNC